MNTDDLDFVASHGRRAVILGSGQRVEPASELPRDAGLHLVAGRARRGGLRHVADLPRGRVCLSPNYRWLGVIDETDGRTLRLYDTAQSARPGFCFELPSAGCEPA